MADGSVRPGFLNPHLKSDFVGKQDAENESKKFNLSVMRFRVFFNLPEILQFELERELAVISKFTPLMNTVSSWSCK